ncbi:hypothetical protein HQ487_02995 [Candidatus Uhrbacteria bacterium]|nr:hypothetical protein [Candidatus Uhrbacteria bacterium]
MASKDRFPFQHVWMGLIALLFLVGSLVLMNPAYVFVSPDETANGFFAERVAQTLIPQGEQNDLLQSFDRLHPRSTLVLEGRVVPGSFLGLPVLYGFFVMILGSKVLWFLTPLLTIIAAFAWKKLIARFTSDLVGALAFALFLLHPAIWYYTARGLMHNVLFLDLLVLGAWLWVNRPIGRGKTPSIWNELFAGLLIGLTFFVRTSEALWMTGALLLAGLIWWRTISWGRLRAGMFGLTVGIALLLLMNTLTYGSAFTTGYTIGSTPVIDIPITDSIDSVALLPFGFHPMNAWRHFLAYGVTMFWWISLLALPGFFLLLAQKAHRRTLRFVVALATGISIWLVFMYGSWEIHDNPDPTQITMANSYVRYWLPMYVCATPMVAMTIRWVSSRGRSTLTRGLIIATFLLAVIGLNVNATFLQGQDGLLKMRAEVLRGAEIQESVLRYTEVTSVIIVDRADKLFFPHRSVWYPLRDEATYEAMPALVEESGLYYYGITFPEEDLTYLNESRLKRMNLGIERIETYDEESLYRISITP